MNTSPQYTRLAHRRTVLRSLQQLLKEKYIEGGSGRPEPLVCEDAMYKDRVVSQDALLEVLDILEQLDATESLEMTKFELKERDMPRLRLPSPPSPTDAQATVTSPPQSSPSGQGSPQEPPQDAGGGQPGSAAG